MEFEINVKRTRRQTSGLNNEYYEEVVPSDYYTNVKVPDSEVSQALSSLILRDYFCRTTKKRDNEIMSNELEKFIEDFDLFETLSEAYKEELQSIYQRVYGYE